MMAQELVTQQPLLYKIFKIDLFSFKYLSVNLCLEWRT